MVRENLKITLTRSAKDLKIMDHVVEEDREEAVVEEAAEVEVVQATQKDMEEEEVGQAMCLGSASTI
jgi:hypothetical protein